MIPSDAYVSLADFGYCKVCGNYRDLRYGSCLKCSPKVDGKRIPGGYELWETNNPENRWIVIGH